MRMMSPLRFRDVLRCDKRWPNSRISRYLCRHGAQVECLITSVCGIRRMGTEDWGVAGDHILSGLTEGSLLAISTQSSWGRTNAQYAMAALHSGSIDGSPKAGPQT